MNPLKTPIVIDGSSIITFFKGALGAMTFGAYHQYNTNKIMEINNKIYDKQIEELRTHIIKLEKAQENSWFK